MKFSNRRLHEEPMRPGSSVILSMDYVQVLWVVNIMDLLCEGEGAYRLAHFHLFAPDCCQYWTVHIE
jgi:hypothetical protein